eukprot:g33140.t1
MLSLSLNMMASPRDLASPRTALIPVPRLGEVRSARPGGGLTGGLSGNGLSLRPGGGGVALTAPVRESATTTSGNSGYPKEAPVKKTPPAPVQKDDWRQDAAEHQNAKQKMQKGDKGGKNSQAGKRPGRDGRGGRRLGKGLEPRDVMWTHTEIARRMKSILNKLTLEKFDDLTRQLCECGISKEAHLKILMTEVFEKATTQHHFIEMYTNLCVHFNDWCSEHLKVGKFKPVLLQQCQESFEANLKDPPKDLSDQCPSFR